MAHAMRDAREGHSVTYLQSKEVPAGIHVRHAEGRPRRDRDWQIPKAALRTESTSDRPSNRLGELSRLAGCLKLHSTSKCAKWLMLRAEKRFLSRAPLQAPEGRVAGTQARHIPAPGPLGRRWVLSYGRTKKGPSLQQAGCNRVFRSRRQEAKAFFFHTVAADQDTQRARAGARGVLKFAT